jgi:hypothetical protein
MLLYCSILVGFNNQGYSQNITLTGNIFEYATYYINSFDLSTGATNVQIFRYQLTSDEFPTDIKINFRASMISPTLGINSEQTIIEIQTNTFTLNAPMLLDNRDISSETTVIYDQANPPNTIELSGQVIESLDPMQADAILQSVMTTGKIADGEYTFSIQVLSDNDQVLASDSKTINIQSPVSITLESPAGSLADTLDNTIYTNFPIFQWFSQPCNGCESYIRISHFNPSQHNSPEDAIEDQRVLPFDQSEDWSLLDAPNSFQYPLTGAYPLEPGNVYCWQVMIKMPTTSGFEEMLSNISVFKIGISGEIENSSMISNPFLLALKNTLGDDQFNALFGPGNDLQGFIPTGQLEVNGVSVDESSINYLLGQIQSDALKIRSVTIE